LSVRTDDEYSQKICEISAYWVYRIRCSIAHNKIGEYILNYKDEEFLVNCAEPFLKEIVFQFHKTPQ